MDTDWPTQENRQRCREVWIENGPDKAKLIFRHVVYARHFLEKVFHAPLSTIELVYLRRTVEKGLEACIRFDDVRQEADEPGINPVQEAVEQWLSQCLDLTSVDFNRVCNSDGVEQADIYFHRQYAMRQDDAAIPLKDATA